MHLSSFSCAFTRPEALFAHLGNNVSPPPLPHSCSRLFAPRGSRCPLGSVHSAACSDARALHRPCMCLFAGPDRSLRTARPSTLTTPQPVVQHTTRLSAKTHRAAGHTHAPTELNGAQQSQRTSSGCFRLRRRIRSSTPCASQSLAELAPWLSRVPSRSPHTARAQH